MRPRLWRITHSAGLGCFEGNYQIHRTGCELQHDLEDLILNLEERVFSPDVIERVFCFVFAAFSLHLHSFTQLLPEDVFECTEALKQGIILLDSFDSKLHAFTIA